MKQVIIIGAGIGGLCTAIALKEQGFRVKVYERFEAVQDLGAGIILHPNAIRALEELGIKNAVQMVGHQLHQLGVVSQDGEVLSAISSKTLKDEVGETMWSFHRADLHALLMKMLPEGAVEMGKTFVKAEQKGEKVEVHFKDGTQVEGDVLIGADGMNSSVRKQFVPESHIRYSGYTCWRGVVQLDLGDQMDHVGMEVWGRGKRFGIIPLSGKRVYWFAMENSDPDDEVMMNYHRNDFQQSFDDFPPEVQRVISHIGEPHDIIWGDIEEVKPPKTLVFGRVALIGDAAHAMTPNLGQGGGIAIEDAVVIAKCLTDSPSVEEALDRYEAKRLTRVMQMVKRSENLGKIAQWEGRVSVAIRNWVTKKMGDSMNGPRLRKMYDVRF